MKIYIFGSNGMLGTYVKLYLIKYFNVIAFTRVDYDIENLDIVSLENLLLDNNIAKDDIIINCSGAIPQGHKIRNLNTKSYYIINSLFPTILSQICDKYNTKMIHITSDCVFSGKCSKNWAYSEDSPHDSIEDYGMSKSLGEYCKATIIRTSIIGEEIRNKKSFLEWIKSNKNGIIDGYANHYWNGVTCLQLAKVIHEIINEKNFWIGIRHIFSPKRVSKYELANIINDIYELNITINKKYPKNKINRTLTTVFEQFEIPDLILQINEQKNFNINT